MSAPPSVRAARRIGSFPRPRTDSWTMIGQDGGQSIDLGDRTLMVFADTLLLPRDADAAPEHRWEELPEYALDFGERSVFLANCAAVLDGPDLRTGLRGLRFFSDAAGFPVEILAPTEEEHAAHIRFWPAHGIGTDDGVFLFYLGIETLDPRDPWAFRNVGVGLARVDPETGRTERIRRGGDWRLWAPRSDDFHFGVQVVADDGHAHVFGSLRHGLDVTALLARVPVADIAEPAAYRFYDADRDAWLPDVPATGGLGPCGGDYSVSFNPHLEQYLMVYVDPFEKELTVRIAHRIEGPYSAPERVGRLPHAEASTLIYLGFEHPRFALDDGRRVLVSYCEPLFELCSLVEVSFR